MDAKKIEEIRAEFEAWYATQKRDQIASWHPVESLEFGKDKYPNGRYTIWSGKQSAWETWQAAHFTATNQLDLVPDDKYDHNPKSTSSPEEKEYWNKVLTTIDEKMADGTFFENGKVEK